MMFKKKIAFSHPADSSPHMCICLVTLFANTVGRQSFLCASINSLPDIFFFKQEMAIHLRPQHFAIGIVSILNGKADVEMSQKQAVFIDRALA